MTANLLGIDYGRQRVGLALAGEQGPERFATLANDDGLVAGITRILAEQGIGTVVLGLPRTSDGDDTAWTAEVREFGVRLAESTDAQVILQDEFASTTEAQARLEAQHVAPAGQKALIDQEAAVLLLEDYLHAV